MTENNDLTAKFKTITPVYTGDAWMEWKNIKKSSILGGLRFWFEVFLLNNENYKNLLEDKKVLIIENPRNKKNPIFDWNLVDFLFGKDEWKDVIEVEINCEKEFDQYNTWIWKMDNWRNNKLWYFYPKKDEQKCIKLTLDFNEVIKKYKFFSENNIKCLFIKDNPFEWKDFDFENLLQEYLDFLDKFGYIWWKWNLGLGRIQKIDNEVNNNFENYINGESAINNVKNQLIYESNLKLFKNWNNKEISLKDLFVKLKQQQNKLRGNYRNGEWNDSYFDKRHKIFWYTTKPNWNCTACENRISWTEWSKMLPWIYKNNENWYESWFLNISMIKNLPNN